MEASQQIKNIRRELELIVSQLRHATVFDLSKDRIKSATDNLNIQLKKLAEIEAEIREQGQK